MGEGPRQARHWWETMPGILTGIAALITAIGGIVAIYFNNRPVVKPSDIPVAPVGAGVMSTSGTSGPFGVTGTPNGNTASGATSSSSAAGNSTAAADTPRFRPIYITADMISDCVTRGGSGNPTDCAPPGKKVTLTGIEYDRGIIYTQSRPGMATATVEIPDGASSLTFTVGNYWTGGDCGGQAPMRMSVLVNGRHVWSGAAGSAQTEIVPLSGNDRLVMFRGESGDGDERCDDSVWTNVRFR